MAKDEQPKPKQTSSSNTTKPYGIKMKELLNERRGKHMRIAKKACKKR